MNRNLRSGVLVFFRIPAQSLDCIDKSRHDTRGTPGYSLGFIFGPSRRAVLVENAQVKNVGTGCRAILLAQFHEISPLERREFAHGDRNAFNVHRESAQLGQSQQWIAHMSVTAPLIFSVNRATDFSPGVPLTDQPRTMAVNWNPNAGEEVGTMMRNVISVSSS